MKRASTFFKGFGHGSATSGKKARSSKNAVIEASSAILTLGLSTLLERKRRRHSQDGSISSDKEALDTKHEDIVRHLYRLDNLEAEDLQQMFDDFGEGEQYVTTCPCLVAKPGQAESYLRAEVSTSGLEVAATASSGSTMQAPPTEPYCAVDVPFAELDATEQAIAPSNENLDISRSVSPIHDSNSRPISPSPISPLGAMLDEEGIDNRTSFHQSLPSSSTMRNSQALDKHSLRHENYRASLASAPQSRNINPREATSNDTRPTSGTESTQSLLLYTTPGHMALPFPERGSEFLENANFQSTESRVTEVRSLISVVNQEWIERMTVSPRLLSRCAGLSTQTVFEKGISALQQCFRGDLPNTFVEVFGLVHVACAVAYTFHKDDDWCRWEELFNDMLDWRFALTKDSERSFFLDALEHLKRPRSPPDGWLKQINPAEHSVYEPTSLMEFDSSSTGLNDFPLFMLPDDGVLQPAGGLIQQDLQQRLRQGRVMRDCATFLDGKL